MKALLIEHQVTLGFHSQAVDIATFWWAQACLEAKISLSRGWFRSIDLWVMGPARFRCATLLLSTPDGTRTHNPWLRRPVPYPLGHLGLLRSC